MYVTGLIRSARDDDRILDSQIGDRNFDRLALGSIGQHHFAVFKILNERFVDKLLAFVADVELSCRQVVVQMIAAKLDDPAAGGETGCGGAFNGAPVAGSTAGVVPSVGRRRG